MKKLFLTIVTGMMFFHASIAAGTDGEEVQNFVKRFYVEVLNREAEPTGLNDWTNRLTTGYNAGSDVATGFVFSNEFIGRETGNTKFINILYSAFFDRAADEGGFNGWMKQLQDGVSRENVLNGFLYSTEFDNLCKSYGIRAVPEQASADAAGGTVVDFVKRFYSVILNREADMAGLSDWVEKLAGSSNNGMMMVSPSSTDRATASDIATGFVFSAEFTSQNKNNEEFIRILYKAFFNRNADEGGFTGWMTQMNNSTSREDVLNGFIHSNEFINLCNGYHIIAYEGAPIYRVATSTDDDSTTEYTYDTNGNILTYSSTGTYDSYNTTYTYDANNNMLTSSSTNTYADGSTSSYNTTYTYDANSNMLTSSFTNTYGDGSTYSHNSTYTYDANGNMLTVSSTSTNNDGSTGNGNGTYTYDVNGNMLTSTYTSTNSDGSTYSGNSTSTYDANGNMLTSTYTSTNSDGSTYSVNNTYDANGNPLTSTYTGINSDGSTYSGNSTSTYDANGNMLTSTSTNIDSDGSTYSYTGTYTYDTKGNMLTSTDTDSDDIHLYASDSRGNTIIEGTIYADGTTVYSYLSYAYDAHNNLRSTTVDGTVTSTTEWVKVN